MPSWLRDRLSYANVASTLAVVLAAGGFAAAAIPDRHGVIHGCYAKSGGSLRVVSGSTCRRNERRLSLNQKGRTGAAGSALAFAQVAADGTVDPANSRRIAQANVTALTGTSAGTYCFHGLHFTPHNAVASTGDPSGGQIPFTRMGAAFGCPPGTQVSLVINSTETILTPNQFMILLN